ncbi:MAG: trypsin-like peptidase domain-containing protein [Candidatus Cloacimonetes bacterium]|jgi:serine protease Do|nr:trypsin-like peptidase domain-containing protein [Candidatus Cloacimonadota bacterium]MDY0337312.1 trypsin-like peptidase domain-containing protein [Candidatus Cloacimonadaceae bacterium]MCK9333992.1 trypsin-like peptidase domain-containing protein [Candidatus Cloacimonadota bacterium]MDD2543777.1 trypsin-like peptidase domain-containing protein [Candidatus Cloacimonadota bacterium]MDD2682700.1 trypsin-like peptidase domain-containing protein [Candidatus Cloacimonadota bacterium]
MRSSSILILVVAIIIINAGISLVLINHFQKTGNEPASMFSAAPAQSSDPALRSNAITQAVTSVEPAVVSVNVTEIRYVRGLRALPFGFGFFDFFDVAPQRQEIKSIGSGVIYDPEGYVITNAHVVSGASEIKVVLPDKREYIAELIGIDEMHDIAKLKIQGNNLPHARLGNSDDLIIGEWSIAVGNPYGMLMNDSKPSVTVGVISALGRNFSIPDEKQEFRNMIQTDAAVNPGNSGGPLVNIQGEVIGINTFIFSESKSNSGVGFAIPINYVKQIVESF